MMLDAASNADPQGRARPAAHARAARRLARRAVAMIVLLGLAVSAVSPAAAMPSRSPSHPVLVLVAPGNAEGPAAGSVASAALADARRHAARLGETAAAARADLGSGSLVRAVDRLAHLAGVAVPALAPQPAGVPVAGVPEGLGAPLAVLLEAARAAVGEVTAARVAHGARATFASGRARALALDLLGRDPTVAPAPGAAAQFEAVRGDRHVVALQEATAAAARRLAHAVDRTRPLLHAVAADLPAAGRPGAACDIHDARPWLCVGGTGANTHDVEAVILVELGGDDTYTGSVAGPSSLRCVASGDTPECAVGVILDLGGDDTYAPAIPAATASDHFVGIAAAWQGVGILVDAAGNDRYLVDVPDLDRPLRESYTTGAANMGVGLLVDLDGDDRYEVAADAGDLFEPYAQGAALVGLGGLADLGGRNLYRVAIAGQQAMPTPGVDPSNDSYYPIAQAVGLFGAGALYDRTGRALLAVDTAVEAGPSPVYNIVNPIAQAVAVAGGAALLTGTGSTTYRVGAHRTTHAEYDGAAPAGTRLGGATAVTAHAVGAIAVAVLDDAGGNDCYVATSTSVHGLVVRGSDAALDLSGTVFGIPGTSGAGVSAQGLASGLFAPDAGALLADHGGDDVYIARSEFGAEAVARPDSGDGHATVTWDFLAPTVTAYGQGLGSAAPGIVLDTGGDDDYELVARGIVAATSTAPGAATAAALSPSTGVWGQGATAFTPAVGALLDLGGSDRYHAEARGRATATPTAERAFDLARTARVQGASGGVLADLDDAVADRFSHAPATGAIPFRGEGPGWVDASGTGVGVAPGQPPKADTVLVLDPANPDGGDDGVLAFRGRLEGPGGPLPGREVTFHLQWLSTGVIGGWQDHDLSSHAHSAADGTVTGLLDVGQFVRYWRDVRKWEPSQLSVRVVARWAGDTAHRATESAQTFTITPPSQEAAR